MYRHLTYLVWQISGTKACIKCHIEQYGDQYTITVPLPKQSSIVVVRGLKRSVTRQLDIVNVRDDASHEQPNAFHTSDRSRPVSPIETSIHVIIRYRETIYRFYNGYSCRYAFQADYINYADGRMYYYYYHANGALRSVDISCRVGDIHHDVLSDCDQCKNVSEYSVSIEEAFPDIVQRFMNFIRGKK